MEAQAFTKWRHLRSLKLQTPEEEDEYDDDEVFDEEEDVYDYGFDGGPVF